MSRDQFKVFRGGEGNAWLERNLGKIDIDGDPVLEVMKAIKIKPERVLEIGCANGWRLQEIKKRYGSVVNGIDPKENDSPGLYVGGAHDLSAFSSPFDLVIYGFCLYLCDRDDLFKIAMEGDRVLADGGTIIVYDFFARSPRSVKYKHKEGLLSYHFDYSLLWRLNPHYTVVKRHIVTAKDTEVVVLRKNTKRGWPLKNDDSPSVAIPRRNSAVLWT